jgi:hypothetical protein
MNLFDNNCSINGTCLRVEPTKKRYGLNLVRYKIFTQVRENHCNAETKIFLDFF